MKCLAMVAFVALTHAFRQTLNQKRSITSLAAKGNKPKNPYAPTILLPETDFSQRANAVVREPQLQTEIWKDLYDKLSQERAESPRFVLHDGPPYANGDLHCGHALNKILKDFINRFQLAQGKQVHYVPGWDCHGLPIELKVLQSLKSKERQSLTPVQLRQKAADFAKETVESQSQAFQRYGIFGQFDKPYMTLQPELEAAQIGVFGKMWLNGYISRGRKPVHWSPSSRTALAEAELEYPDGHVSKSIYVAFPLESTTEALKDFPDAKVAIWTTTPWTIPANLAVAVNPDLAYAVVETGSQEQWIVAQDLVESLSTKLGTPLQIVKSVTGEELVGSTYRHPLYDRVSPVVAGGDYITTESGTGLVHTAPGHGAEDYLTGLKYQLDILSPVDDAGRFTAEAGEKYAGMNVLKEGNEAMMEALQDAKALLLQEDYQHKYPYDWRTKKPTIFRATNQWFASVEGFRDQALEAISTVRWVPEAGENRIRSFVDGRNDWCISRQRSWGVPIPVFYDDEDNVLLNEETLEHIQSLFAEHGSDCWWTMDEAELLPEKYYDAKWRRGTDTMDVWFDSGSTWAGVAQARGELEYPADLYLEGSDQHRGWFQSSLLTSVANNNKAPYKTVLTHGFVLDEKGLKMSKSLGNVLDPRTVIDGGNNKKKEPPYGADVLRLWVASSDYSGDVLIGDNILKQTFESYRKLRNTARYMIGNLADYQPDGDDSTAIPYEDLPSLDKYMLGKLSTVLKTVNEAMEDYQFQRAVQEILRFSTADLSNFYLDIAKDRLYISSADDYRRRSCQTVISACLDGFTKAIAPILPHMAEDIWQNLPYTQGSVFQQLWPELEYPQHDEEQWNLVRNLRDDVNKVLEEARSDKAVGASLDAAAYIYVPDESKRKLLEPLVGDAKLISPPKKTNGVDEFRTVLMLSQVELVDSIEDWEYASSGETSSGCSVGITKAKGTKCARCWFHDEGVEEGGVCQRCNGAIHAWEEKTGQVFAREDEPAPIS